MAEGKHCKVHLLLPWRDFLKATGSCEEDALIWD